MGKIQKALNSVFVKGACAPHCFRLRYITECGGIITEEDYLTIISHSQPYPLSSWLYTGKPRYSYPRNA